ncbi:MAG: 50S ribosomal protein L9 [Anaerolineae bacterium]
MKIVLIQDVPNLGQAGEVKEVADGYGRNYLIPKGLAVLATEGTLKQLELKRQAEARRAERLRAEMTDLAQRLSLLTLNFKAKVGEKERLYGSITSGDIARAIERETGQAVDKRKIGLEEPIRQLGYHHVPIKLLPDLTTEVVVLVEEE